MARAYGEEIAKAMTFFTGVYGSPLKKDLTVVETEDGTPNGYSAPGILFLSPQAIGKQVNTQAGGEPGVAAVVGHAGFADHAQSHVDRERPGALLRAPVRGARQRRRCAWNRKSTTPTSRR